MRSRLGVFSSTPIRFRVASGAFVLGALLVLLVVQVTVSATEDGLRRQFDDRAAALLNTVTIMSTEPLLTAEYAQHNELLHGLGHDQEIRTIDLVNTAGQIVSSNHQSRVGLDSASAAAELDFDEQSAFIDGPVVSSSGMLGTVRIMLDKMAIAEAVESERRRGLLFGLLGVAAVALVSLFAGKVLTRRVTDLESQLGIVDGNGLPLSVHVTGHGEIARLGTALNQRTNRIRAVVDANVHARSELELSEAKLQLALVAAADAVIEVEFFDGVMTIVGTNTTNEEIRDLASADLDQIRAWTHPDDQGLVRKAVMKALSQSPTYADVTDVEVRLRPRGPDWRHFLIRVHASVGTKEASTRVLIAIVDITDQRLAERHLARVDKMQAIGQLTAGIAHDFNNALAVSRLQLSVLMRPDRDRERDDIRLQQLAETNRNATEMVRRLLGAVAPQVSPPARVDIVDFVESISGVMRTMLGPDVEFRLGSDSEHNAVELDQAAIQQLFLNLAKNARDAMQGVGRVNVRIWNPSDTAVAIDFADTGPGIDASVIDSLFDPFVTTKPLGAGTGLGLATAYETAATAGGSITASNNEAGGATFTVTLPLAQGPGAPIPTDIAHQAGKHVLVVEDNIVLLGGLVDLLSAAGYHVAPASSLADAVVTAAEMDDLDLLLTDVGLPDGTGFELRKRVEEIKPQVATLFMTAFLSPEAVAALSAGEPFLLKPFDDETALSIVAAALHVETTSSPSP